MPDVSIEMFYDGECPLCLREVRLLQRLDKRGRIRFTDITAAMFEPPGLGLTRETLMDRIHGRLSDGTIIAGVEVFRRLYAAVGFGPLVWLSRLPGIAQVLDLAYRWFAKHRLRLTGRCSDKSCTVHPAQGDQGC